MAHEKHNDPGNLSMPLKANSVILERFHSTPPTAV